jgi:hypothetical protein
LDDNDHLPDGRPSAGQVGQGTCDHIWTVTLIDDSVGADCYTCGAQRVIPKSEALDLIVHGATYRRIAAAARRYVTDRASMDAAWQDGGRRPLARRPP